MREALGFLVDYARFHFHEEEQMMERYGYAEIEGHRAKHRRLMDQAFDMQRRFEERERMEGPEIATMLREWIVGHVLSDDRRFAQMLNAGASIRAVRVHTRSALDSSA